MGVDGQRKRYWSNYRVLERLRFSLDHLNAAIEGYEKLGGDPDCRNKLDDISDQLRESIKEINGERFNGEENFSVDNTERARFQAE